MTFVEKYIAAGIDYALNDSVRSGRPNSICDDEKAWITNIACTKPKDIGYVEKLWTYIPQPPKAYKETLHGCWISGAFPDIAEYSKDYFGKR